MVFSALRKAPLAALLMLGCATLPAQAGWFSSDDDKPAQKTEKQAVTRPQPAAANSPAANLPATNLEDSIHEAQLLRLAGQYPEAVKHLSQLMMVAADDARVISEYGKTLAAMGRASDAVNFLTRAQQLQPGDWTIYSAIGVAYDQLGNQKAAQDAYEHALVLKPEEPSVLSNYALSRMLAKEPDMALKLAARAETAVGTSDPKITRNIAMIRSMAPPVPAPVTAANLPQAPMTLAAKPAPHALEAHDSRVVMQRVPVDSLAGPVQAPKPSPVNTATQAPRSLQPQLAAAPQPHLEAPKPFTSQPLPAPAAPVKAAENKPAPVAAAPVKAMPAAPVAIARAVPPAPVKAVETASASVTLRLTPPLKSESDKPAQPPKVLPPTPIKAASKDAVPGLRVSASAY